MMEIDPTSLKWCNGCLTDKPISEFYQDHSRANGLTNYCKTCVRNRRAAAKAAGKVKTPSTQKKRQYRLKRKYNMDPATYAALEAQQGGVCAVCGQPETALPYLSVDHDHTTGKVRGLLCRSCNFALGLIGDSPERAEAMAAYLRANVD